jgi:hypothetical protein
VFRRGATLNLFFDAELSFDLRVGGEQVSHYRVGDLTVDQGVGVLQHGLGFEGYLSSGFGVDTPTP